MFSLPSGTYLPAWLLRSLIIHSGISWLDVDRRSTVSTAILMRLTQFALSHFSSALNPIIYFYTNKDIYVGFKKLLGRRGARFSNEKDFLTNGGVSVIDTEVK